MESGILFFGIRNTAQGDKNPTNDWNPEFKSLTKSGIQYLESGIHGEESRIEDCRGFTYMGWSRTESFLSKIIHYPVVFCDAEEKKL